ncbi:antibiotic biosynthesis monooxygenase family protein [Roseospira visakhapatnamensis]|uniref:Heme-degrading monooxygenase HmoA n=1 Tax=Roseospira visakhapatnamensis TaxID=390880 RepID=A0A7W6RDL5_9PROT|nr:antibiotic biosynthesis monooxygenase [Roseospira visakhapatnamensis]MBB4266512.1 heme-degrading monooxygenase HmoA [Roseospira visakhapatnamensis]
MIMVIDFLEASDLQRARETWWAVSGVLSRCAGFQDGQLLETFDTVQPRVGYPLASATRWDSAADWDQARAAARSDPKVLAILGASGTRFTSLKADLVDGRAFTFRGESPHMVLFDIVYLAPGQAEDYAAMWHEANAYMGARPGFVNASLHRSRAADDAIAFVNIAEWETTDLFFDAVHTARFAEIVESFKEDFSLLLTRRVLHRGPNATSLLTGDAA